MPNKTGTAVDRAIEYLTHLMAVPSFSRGQRLPSIDALARAAFVSRVPMWKAVRVLRDRGLLSVNPGGAIRSVPDDVWCDEPRSEPWQKRKALLVRDIIEGRFGPSESLPSIKELKARYGCGYGTVRKMLDAVAAEGLVVMHKRSYRVSVAARTAYRPRIVFLSDGRSLDELLPSGPRVEQLIAGLETEAVQLNIRVELLGLNTADSGAVQKLRWRLRSLADVEGFVLNLWWSSIPASQRLLLDTIALLLSWGKSVAILDQIGNFELPAELRRERRLCVFRIAGASAGTDLACRLLANKHRRIAYVSSQPSEGWSSQRLRGITEAYRAAGARHDATPFAPERDIHEFDLALAACDVPRKKFEAVYRRRLSSEEFSDWMARYRTMQGSDVLAGIAPEALRQARAALAVMTALGDPAIDAALFQETLDALFVKVDNILLARFLRPQFDRALADRRITAWVCANDTVGVAALEFLRERSVAVPGDLSVVGFDNIHEAAGLRLSSYDFGFVSIARQMLLFIRTGRTAVPVGAGRRVETRGFLVERRSLGRARDG